MEVNAPPALYGDRDSERGAGGKLRKPSTRNSKSTPYDRPPTNQQGRGGNWLSKIVDPAYRLVAGGATKIIPYFFSKSPAAVPLPPSAENLATPDRDVTTSADANGKCTVTHDVPQSTERSGPSEVAAFGLKGNCQSEELRQDKSKMSDDNSQISQIEQIIKGKTFSGDEINRLMEIISSRISDVSDVQKGERNEMLTTAGGSERVLLTPLPKTLDVGNQEDMKRVISRTAAFLPQPSVQDEIGASPVDIARAYMGSRISEQGPGPFSVTSKGGTTRQPSNEFASKPSIPSSAPRLSTGWPGAMAQEQHGYRTPNQRGRHGLHDFPRTPYSRSIYSKSRAQLTPSQADSRYLITSLKPFKQSQTPIFGQVKSRHDVPDNSYGSIGPIRRVQNKFASETRPRGSIFLKSSKDAPLPVNQPVVSQGHVPDLEKNLEPSETSTSKQQPGDHAGKRVGNNPLLYPSSSQAVKRILEQLDRHKPTPQEKAEELKLAAAWKKSPPEASQAMLKENASFTHAGEFGSLKKPDLFDTKLLSEENKLGGNSKSQVESLERSIEAKDAVLPSSNAPATSFIDSMIKSDANSGPLFSVKSTSQLKSFQEKTSRNNPFQSQINGQPVSTSPSEPGIEPSKKPQLHSSGSRPILPHISVGRQHDPLRSVSSDNVAAFTFPLSASLSILSEPPTPSFMPFSSSGMVSQPKEVPTVPAYSFGTKKSTPPLVFSFPSTSNAPTHVEAHDLKFNFGSDKTRLSFGSVGKDAICS
ncbi:hypothetical protein ACH5RR_005840 [Cinchona calisaya]|uniref:Nuclear pore complex protein NUP1 n=1 Tax=Cinchona calisaya TaxID=153742 RepID=A0ABD3AMD3_9GENT